MCNVTENILRAFRGHTTNFFGCGVNIGDLLQAFVLT